MAPASTIQTLVQTLVKTTKFIEIYELVEKNLELLKKNPTNLPQLLAQFDLEVYSPVNAACIMLMYEPSYPDKSNLITITAEFMEAVHLNKRLIPWLCVISTGFVERLIALKQPQAGLLPMMKLITKYQASPVQLTPFHADLLQLALVANNFNPILRFLSSDILELPKNRQIDPKNYLCFFYYLGMIYAAVKQFEKSLQAFDNCLLMPCLLKSKIMVEAAKKQVLVSLIVHGTYSPSSQSSQSSINEATCPWKRRITLYLDFATQFRKGTLSDLNYFMEMHRVNFEAERNWGLVKQAREAFIRNRIKGLTKTFITMPLVDLASRVGLQNVQQAEDLLLDMMQTKEIFAKISQKDGTVHFMDDPEQYDSAGMFLKINAKIDACVDLEKYLRSLSDQIVTSNAYAKYSVEAESRSKTSSSNLV